MIKQEITWYSIKEDGNPKTENYCALFVKNKMFKKGDVYEIIKAFYNPREDEWVEARDEFGGREIKSSEYELLYYTQDVNTKDVVNLVFGNKDSND
nr:MAG TPA: hypothetical protein [Caudoviricetes sp.]